MPARRKTASQTLRVATWNINSLRLRLGLLNDLVTALDPDVICLQETKVPDDLFPGEGPPALGYKHVAFRGMKGYLGISRRFSITISVDLCLSVARSMILAAVALRAARVFSS